MRPQAHPWAQAEDRVLQRRTTLKDEEPEIGLDELVVREGRAQPDGNRTVSIFHFVDQGGHTDQATPCP
jgi:hypothetical protein